MSPEVLRQAAEKMRERAEAATAWPSRRMPWIDQMSPDGTATVREPKDVGRWDESIRATCYEPEVALHIASWHPAVALAVADLIDHHVDRMETTGFVGHLHTDLVNVARAYLGGDA